MVEIASLTVVSGQWSCSLTSSGGGGGRGEGVSQENPANAIH